MNKQRQALIKVLAVGYYGPNSPLHKIIYEALAEPEQEPVADSDLYAVWLNGLHSRKPLTDSEIFNTAADYYEGHGFKALEFARAIERAHGITE